ncbi:MAG: hypothetical protein AB1505_12495 [Candidatus Latescibacterota bacterium]
MEPKVVRLDPLVRRAVSSQAGQAAADLHHPEGGPAPPALECGACHGTGVVPGWTGDGDLIFKTCRSCRTDDLFAVIGPTGEGDWIAVRDMAHTWGRGASPVEALLAMEHRTDPRFSVFSPRYLIPERQREILPDAAAQTRTA